MISLVVVCAINAVTIQIDGILASTIVGAIVFISTKKYYKPPENRYP